MIEDHIHFNGISFSFVRSRGVICIHKCHHMVIGNMNSYKIDVCEDETNEAKKKKKVKFREFY